MVLFRLLFSFSKRDIDYAFKHASLKKKTPGLKLLYAPLPPTEKEKPKYGKLLIVIPRTSGNAVQRNMVRRRLKAIYYEEKLYETPLITILLVRKQAMQLSFDQLKQFLTGALTS